MKVPSWKQISKTRKIIAIVSTVIFCLFLVYPINTYNKFQKRKKYCMEFIKCIGGWCVGEIYSKDMLQQYLIPKSKPMRIKPKEIMIFPHDGSSRLYPKFQKVSDNQYKLVRIMAITNPDDIQEISQSNLNTLKDIFNYLKISNQYYGTKDSPNNYIERIIYEIETPHVLVELRNFIGNTIFGPAKESSYIVSSGETYTFDYKLTKNDPDVELVTQ